MIILAEPLTLNANVATIALPEDVDVEALYADGAAITVIGTPQSYNIYWNRLLES